MTYSEAEQFLLSLSNLPRKPYMSDTVPSFVYLKRIKKLLEILDNPQNNIPHYIHITGTSGKGSTALFLANILKENKNKTGLFLSPHISKITERWTINGKSMPQKTFIDIVKKLKIALNTYIQNSKLDIPSFFELMTVIALYYFSKEKVDWAILEVGCGGKYDSTNIIPKKDVAIITNIDLDHTHILGNTKIAIAEKKSGIIIGPCQIFTREKNKKILELIAKKAKSKKAIFHKEHKKSLNISFDWNGTSFVYKDKAYQLSIPGEHQVKNATLAIDVANSLGILNKTIYSGLKKTLLPIRLEKINNNPTIILDGAHNPAKIKTTVNTLLELKNKQDIHFVLGFSDGKNIPEMIRILSLLKPKTIACTRFTLNTYKKAASPSHISKYIKRYIPKATTTIWLDPKEALDWSKKQQKKYDILLATGSIYLAGEIRPMLTK